MQTAADRIEFGGPPADALLSGLGAAHHFARRILDPDANVGGRVRATCAGSLVEDLEQRIAGEVRSLMSELANWKDLAESRGRHIDRLVAERDAARGEVDRLRAAIITHRSQKADDRCIEDDDRLYDALGDGIKCDRRVGDKDAMLASCRRFIERRCEGGGWPTYAELEAERDATRTSLDLAFDALVTALARCGGLENDRLNLLDALIAAWSGGVDRVRAEVAKGPAVGRGRRPRVVNDVGEILDVIVGES
jgi:hypothetical protein